MRTTPSVLALAMPPAVCAGAPVECTAAELQQINKTADAQGGIIHACELDTGSKLS